MQKITSDPSRSISRTLWLTLCEKTSLPPCNSFPIARWPGDQGIGRWPDQTRGETEEDSVAQRVFDWVANGNVNSVRAAVGDAAKADADDHWWPLADWWHRRFSSRLLELAGHSSCVWTKIEASHMCRIQVHQWVCNLHCLSCHMIHSPRQLWCLAANSVSKQYFAQHKLCGLFWNRCIIYIESGSRRYFGQKYTAPQEIWILDVRL